MAWIEAHQALRDHRKVLETAELLDLPEPHVVGHLVFLWLWALDNAPDGQLPESARIIERAAGWTGEQGAFLSALIEVGFIHRDDGALTIHDWDDYAGKLIAQRKANADRQKRHRDRQKSDVTEPLPESDCDVTVTSQSRNGATVHNSTQHNRTVTPSPPESEKTSLPAQSQQNGADAPPPEAAQPIAAKIQPFDLLAAMCDAVGQEPIVLSENEKRRQLAVAKRLMASGVSPPDVADITAWLAGQPQRTGGIDMFTVEQNLTRWRLKGKPTANGIDVSHLPWNHPKRAAITGKGIIG